MNIDYFSLDGLIFEKDEVQLHSVYDGDTITLIMPIHNTKYKWRCRLLGVNTPEIRGGSIETKESGYKSRDIVKELLENNLEYMKVYCHKFDKYGRVLIKLEINNTKYGHINDLSQWLVDNGYGVEYNL